MEATSRRLVCAGTSLALLLALAMVGPKAEAKDTVAFTISDSRITESSGLARETRNNRYWTVNDSDDSGTVYAVNEDGDVEGTLEFRAAPVDIEALAMYNERLYVGDIGDNGGNRDFVTVYFFDEPAATGQTVQYRSYDFSYPDGPEDAETLIVDPLGRLYIVTKGADAGIYAAPAEPSRLGVNELERVADAPAFVTDGVYLPDVQRIALRTYVSVEVLDATSYDAVARAALPAQPEGESICLSLDGESLMVGSEGKNSKVYRVAVPQELGEAPTPQSSPPATSALSPKPSSPASSDDSEANSDGASATEGKSRRGTFLAVGLAALVALVAGSVVFGVKGRRE